MLNNLLSNSTFTTALGIVAPQIVPFLPILNGLCGFRLKKDTNQILENRLALVLKEITETKSPSKVQELEIRLHELLGIILEAKK